MTLPIIPAKYEPACGEDDDTCIPAVSITSSLQKCVMMLDMEPENVPLWARTLARDEPPALRLKRGRKLAQTMSK